MTEQAHTADPSQSGDALFTAVYARLKAMAGRALDRASGSTLDTTALVHELYLRVGARDELRRANALRDFMVAAFQEAQPSSPRDGPPRITEVVEQAVARAATRR